MKQAVVNVIKGMARPRMERRIPAVVLSIVCMGFCVAMLDRISFGADPCSTMNLGISGTMGWSFGTWQMICNMLLFVIMMRFDTSRFGLGTIVNSLFVGYIAEFFMGVLDHFPMISASLPLLTRTLIFLPVGLLFLFVVAVYIVADMGVAPYDAMPQIIAGRTGWPFLYVRMVWDIAAMGIGFVLGANVGPMTLLIAFGLGPLVGIVAKKIDPFFA